MAQSLTDLYGDILIEPGGDPEGNGLAGTTERAAQAIRFFTGGYRQSLEEVSSDADRTSPLTRENLKLVLAF